jgi:hypothetical protein
MMDDKNISGNKIGQDDRMDRMRCPGLDRGRTNYGRPAVRAVSAHRGGALAADLRCLGDLLLNPESSISKSLIFRIGLTQVVDFHDFSAFFVVVPVASTGGCTAVLEVRIVLMQVVDFHDSFR